MEGQAHPGASEVRKNLPRFVNSVDHHLFLKLIDFAAEHKLYNEQSLQSQKLKILLSTHLYVEAKEVASKVGSDAVKEQIEKDKQEADEKLKALNQGAENILKVFESEDFKSAQNKRGSDLMNKFDISDKEKQAAFDYSKHLYDIGNYKECENVLSNYVKISKSNHFLSCYWGLLNTYILLEQFDKALEVLKDLNLIISKEKITDQDRISARNMFLNTSLFLFQHESNPGEFLLNLLKDYESVLASGSIHLIRYYIAAALLSGDFNILNSSIVKLIQTDSYRYRDAFTTFIETLLENFNYEESINMIKDLEKVCDEDMFLHNLKGQIVAAASNLILSVYATIHHKDDVDAMLEKMNKKTNDIDTFKSGFESCDNIKDRVEELEKLQVELKDMLHLKL